MADIFVSYKKSDAARVSPLVRALEAQGWSVWWDTRLGIGEQFDDAIERELTQAKCVVVVWSHDSITSRWVRTEATEAMNRGILVPILIDDVVQPLAFRLIQTVQLFSGSPSDMDAKWASVIRAIEVHTGRAKAGATTNQAEAAPPRPSDPPRSRDAGNGWMEIGRPGRSIAKPIVAKQAFLDLDGAPEMVIVPAGTFLMGSPADEEDRLDNEGPQHQVTIANPFAVARCPITIGQYSRFVAQTRHRTAAVREVWQAPAVGEDDGRWTLESVGEQRSTSGDRDSVNKPVVLVSWIDASAYAAWLSELTGRVYRLLSEAEWEYAARAGTTTPFWWGRSSSTANAVYDASTVYHKAKRGEPSRGPRDASRVSPNPFGLHDMLGNVGEWVEDYFHSSYASAPADGTAWLDKSATEWRVIRGGGWSSSAWQIRSAARSAGPADRAWPSVGFRVARDIL